MKNVLLVLSTVIALTGCLEQQPQTDTTTLPSTELPAVPPSTPSTPPGEYTGIVLPNVTSVNDLSDLALWDYVTTGTSLNLSVSGSTITYSSPSAFNGDGVTVTSKFKTLGNTADSGSFVMSATLDYSSNNGTSSVIFFDFSTSLKDGLQVSLTTNNGVLAYAVTEYNNGATSDIVSQQYPIAIGPLASAHSVPISIARSNTGLVTLSINGTDYPVSNAAFSNDMNLYSNYSGKGGITLKNFNVSAGASYAAFGGY